MTRETSIEAFEYIRENGLLSRRRWQVYEFLFHNGPCTAAEVTVSLRSAHENSGVYTTRLSELERMGLAKELGTTTCRFTGRTVIVWDVTANKPKKLYRDSLKQSLAELGFDSLDEYYESDWWTSFKEGYFKRHEKKCAITGSTEDVHLHHLTYERIGEEEDGDLIPLKGDIHLLCHSLVDEHKVRLKEAHEIVRKVFKALEAYFNREVRTLDLFDAL